MAEIVFKKGTVISHTELESDEVVIFADETTGALKKMNHLGEVITFAEGLTLEQIEDMLGNSFEDSATVAFVYTDALSSPFSAFVKQDGLDHTQIQNRGINTHAQIDTFITNINETITDKINDTVLTNSPLNKVFNDTANTVTLSLNDSGVVAGTYGSATEIAQPTVNAKGQVTQVATVPISLPSTAITDITEKVQDTVAAMWINGNGIQTAYNDTAGFLTVSVNQANLDHTQIQNRGTNTHAVIDQHLSNTNNPHATTPSQIGAEVAGTASTLINNHLSASDPHSQYMTSAETSANYAAISHTHTSANITDFNTSVDSRISNKIANNAPPVKNISDAASTGSSTNYAREDHSHGFNQSGVNAGSYGNSSNVPSFNVNAQGQITSALNTPISLTSTSITDFNEAVADRMNATLHDNYPIQINYDDPAGIISVGLEDSGVTASTYGNASNVPVLAVNNKGMVTGVTNTPISINQNQVTGLHPVAYSGDYDDLGNTPQVMPYHTSPSPNATGQMVYWDSTISKFRPSPGGWAFDFSTQPTSGQLLQYTLTGSRFNLTSVGSVLSYGNLSDLGNVTNDSPTNGQVLTYDSTQGAWKPSTNSSANIFGSEFQEQTRNTLASTTSTTPLLYTSFSKTVPAGKYRIGAFIIWNLSTTTSNFISELRVNGVSIGMLSIEANEAGTDIRTPSTGFFYYTVPSAQSLDIEIYFRPEVNGITARMYFATLEFWRVQ